ncbi:MAG: regulatory protein RecX [Bacillota bacterium]|nr:regulatory protein RecX [Bacillota bacterium]
MTVDSSKEALKRAGYMLSRRAYSKRELFEGLTEKGFSDDDAYSAVSKLSELNVLDDAKYAESLIRNYTMRGYGMLRVRQELIKHRIPREIIDELINENDAQDELVCALIRKRLRGKTPDRNELKRVSGFLVRRGFSFEQISSSIRKVFGEAEYYE